MSEIENARRQAELLTKGYFTDNGFQSTAELIKAMEILAYGLARKGETIAANSLFIAVANLERANSCEDLND